MEGTVTISIKEFDRLKQCEEAAKALDEELKKDAVDRGIYVLENYQEYEAYPVPHWNRRRLPYINFVNPPELLEVANAELLKCKDEMVNYEKRIKEVESINYKLVKEIQYMEHRNIFQRIFSTKHKYIDVSLV